MCGSSFACNNFAKSQVRRTRHVREQFCMQQLCMRLRVRVVLHVRVFGCERERLAESSASAPFRNISLYLWTLL